MPTTDTGEVYEPEPERGWGGAQELSLGVDPRGFIVAIGHNYWYSSGPGTGYGCWNWMVRVDADGAPAPLEISMSLSDIFDCGVAAAFEPDGRLHLLAALGMRRYPPDDVEWDRFVNAGVVWAFALHGDGTLFTVGPDFLTTSARPFSLAEVSVSGEVTRKMVVQDMEEVVSLVLAEDGGLSLFGRGDVVARSLYADWTDRWSWDGGEIADRTTAVMSRPEGGVWLAAGPTVASLSADGIVEDVLDPNDEDEGHFIVALAELSDGALCSGGDRSGAGDGTPVVWKTTCRNQDGSVRWSALGSKASGAGAKTDWFARNEGNHRFAWTRLQALPDGDLVALVPGDGIVRFDAEGEIRWTMPLLDDSM